MGPEYEALKPKLTLSPLATAAFQLLLDTVTVGPDCEKSPFQPLVIDWSPGKSNVSFQASTASPLLVTLTAAVNPPPHWFWMA